MKRLDSFLESTGAEFLVVGELLIGGSGSGLSMTHGAIRKGRGFEELQASHLYCHNVAGRRPSGRACSWSFPTGTYTGRKGSSLQLTIVRGDHSPRPTFGKIDGVPHR